jgi:GT2 family glycosyltransferase
MADKKGIQLSEKTEGATYTPLVSIIIAAFAMERWNDLCQSVASVQAQSVPRLETVVVIDYQPDLLARARRELSGAIVVANNGHKGASGARNSGVAASRGELLAFLDDDAVASPNCLEILLCHLTDKSVIGVGGRLDPIWATSRPQWFPPEFDWTVGASYLGMPQVSDRVRNVWSNNMLIRRKVFDMVGGFREDFAKVGARSRPEDTDLCLRATKVSGGIWVYEPAAVAGHRVPRNRTTFRYFLYRCFHEGWGKATLAALNGAEESISAERGYTRHVLPAGLARGLREAARGDLSGGLRSFAIVTGFIVVMIGFLIGHAVVTVHSRFRE